MPRKKNVYAQLVEEVFAQRYKVGSAEVPFDREDIESAAQKLGMQLPKNLGDVVYSFRYRTSLPETIREKAPARWHRGPDVESCWDVVPPAFLLGIDSERLVRYTVAKHGAHFGTPPCR